MRTYTVARKPEGLDWSRIPVAAIDNRLWTEPVDIAATAQICYDAAGLYLRLAAREAHIRAEETGPLGMPCEDSCLEFFFCPIWGDPRYFNIEINPNGCLYLGTGTGIHDLVRLLPEKSDLLQIETGRTAEGWEAVFCIPTDFVQQFFPGYAPISGGRIRANFYKCGDLTRQEHYFSWNPVTSETPAFHRPGDFGCLVFE